MKELKNKLKALEGETFFTATGLPFTFELVGENAIRTSRTKCIIS
jgi:hypothetical protein